MCKIYFPCFFALNSNTNTCNHIECYTYTHSHLFMPYSNALFWTKTSLSHSTLKVSENDIVTMLCTILYDLTTHDESSALSILLNNISTLSYKRLTCASALSHKASSSFPHPIEHPPRFYESDSLNLSFMPRAIKISELFLKINLTSFSYSPTASSNGKFTQSLFNFSLPTYAEISFITGILAGSHPLAYRIISLITYFGITSVTH